MIDSVTDISCLSAVDTKKSDEKIEAETSLWDTLLCGAPVEAYDAIMDPNKKERIGEESLRKDVKASKKQWRKIRQERFPFLDSSQTQQQEEAEE